MKAWRKGTPFAKGVPSSSFSPPRKRIHLSLPKPCKKRTTTQKSQFPDSFLYFLILWYNIFNSKDAFFSKILLFPPITKRGCRRRTCDMVSSDSEHSINPIAKLPGDAKPEAPLCKGRWHRVSVTEGACVILDFVELYRYALSLTRLRRELPPGGSL